MAAVSKDLFRKRLVDLCARSHLFSLPRKPQDRHILLRSMVIGLDVNRQYSEQEINETLEKWLTDVAQSEYPDHVSLRRELVDRGYLTRSADGANYQVQPSGSGRVDFEPSVGELDPVGIVAEAREEIEVRRRRHQPNQSG
jgi:hypothetical protein